jgi:hypothetical protein
MTAALEQAAHDKHLLYGAERSKHYELSYPEYVDFLYTAEVWMCEGPVRVKEKEVGPESDLSLLGDWNGCRMTSTSQLVFRAIPFEHRPRNSLLPAMPYSAF